MQKKKRRIWPIVLVTILAVLAVLCIAAYILFGSLYRSTRFVKDSDVLINEELLTETDLVLESEPDFDYAGVPQVSEDSLEGTYSILLIGTDMRTDEYGNSDAMILLTINSNVKKIFMVSFMRDLYAEIPDVGVRKLNNAYAIGGGPLLVSTLESNYGVDIQNYVCVTFETMAEIVDAVGGIDMEMNHDEIVTANDYITSMAEELEYDPEDYYIEGLEDIDITNPEELAQTLTLHLNGVQAVAYARIRYVGNADYERTNRQRKVIMAIMDEASDFDIGTITKLVTGILPHLTHNLTQTQILKLLSMVTALTGYDLETDRIPYDGMYTSQNEILVPDMAETIEKLQSTIYAVE